MYPSTTVLQLLDKSHHSSYDFNQEASDARTATRRLLKVCKLELFYTDQFLRTASLSEEIELFNLEDDRLSANTIEEGHQDLHMFQIF